MAPTPRRLLPPEPSEAANRITKHKVTVSKSSSSSKSSRTLLVTTEALRKAEVIEKTFGSQIPTEDIIDSMEIQIEFTDGKTPLSAFNISQEPAPVNIIDKTDITATSGDKQNFRLASIDLDYPGPNEKLFDEPLNYDETPPLAVSLEEQLNNITEDAAHRVADAKLIFGPVASILDHHCSQATGLHIPVEHASALKKFSEEIILVAKRHFEAFLKGVPAQIHKDGSMDKETNLRNNNLGKTISMPSYAQVANINNKVTSQNATPENNGLRSKKIPNPGTDDRLFLRLLESDPLRELFGYALQSYIKEKLGSNYHLSNILPTKTGFALYPSKGNSSALANELALSNTLNGKLIEKSTVWTSYRISIVPRKICAIKENFEHHLVPVTTIDITAAITAAAGTQPISVFPSRDNDAQPESPTTSWIVRFKDDQVNNSGIYLVDPLSISRLVSHMTLSEL